jgi:MOSC domain-containing protein YiiM
MRVVKRAQALAGRGLSGDSMRRRQGRSCRGSGRHRGYGLTLVQAEALEDLASPDGAVLGHAQARRDVVTRGIGLNALAGRRFRVGEAECLGQRPCEPCSHLERLTTTGVLRGLIHCGGLRADILIDGRIDTRSAIETID